MFRPATVAVSSDPVLLEQILRNLLSNAVKFTSRGAYCWNAYAAKIRSISMSPIPVPASRKTRRKRFSGLLQLDNPARDRNRGIGLGLGTVARTARLLGHPVKVTSKVGEGSIFTVTVPITEAPVKQPEKPGAARNSGRIVFWPAAPSWWWMTITPS